MAEFEAAFAAKVGAAHAVATSNCTTALHLSLLAAGVGPGDEVVVSPHSFIASANAIVHAGARPVFADIRAETLNLDPRLAEAAITPRTKAIMAIHQVGRPRRAGREFAAIAARHKLVLVEDAACAAGSAYRGQPIGRNDFSPLVCFSFHPRKIVSTGDGGMITTGDEALARRLRLLRQHGMSVNDRQRHQSRTVMAEEYPILGYNYRLTDVQAAIGLAQLRRLDGMVERRRAIAARYDAALSADSRVASFFTKLRRVPLEPADLPYPGLARAGAAVRDGFMQGLLDDGVASRRGIMSIHREPCYVERFGPQSFSGVSGEGGERPMRLFAALHPDDGR